MNKKNPQSPQFKCILDTNIIEYAMDRDINPVLIPYLQSVIKRGAELVISEISVYELIKGANPNKRTLVFKTIKDYKRLEITQEILLFAALFEKIYKLQKDLEIVKREFNDIDKIIAATSFHENAFLMTGDTNDFPRPFFKELIWKSIEYKRRNKPITNHICVLRPEFEIIKSGLTKVG